MIVPVGFAVVTARAIAEIDLANQSLVAQEPQRVVYGGETDTRHFIAGRIKDLRGRGMLMARLDHVEHHLPLPSQSCRNLFSPAHETGIIIILNKSVK